MGEYAEMFSSGLLDQFTGEVIDGDAPGYPRSKGKFVCQDCGKQFKTDQAATDHRRDVHGVKRHKSAETPVQDVIRKLPNAVMQTTKTNCFRACVASVLGIAIEDVPAACDGATWDWDAFQDWLAQRGMQAIEIGFGNGGTIYPVRKPVPCIVTGPSPRDCQTGRHAVVGELMGLEGFRLLHDPHPSELWIDGEPTHAVFFVRI